MDKRGLLPHEDNHDDEVHGVVASGERRILIVLQLATAIGFLQCISIDLAALCCPTTQGTSGLELIL